MSTKNKQTKDQLENNLLERIKHLNHAIKVAKALRDNPTFNAIEKIGLEEDISDNLQRVIGALEALNNLRKNRYV